MSFLIMQSDITSDQDNKRYECCDQVTEKCFSIVGRSPDNRTNTFIKENRHRPELYKELLLFSLAYKNTTFCLLDICENKQYFRIMPVYEDTFHSNAHYSMFSYLSAAKVL